MKRFVVAVAPDGHLWESVEIIEISEDDAVAMRMPETEAVAFSESRAKRGIEKSMIAANVEHEIRIVDEETWQALSSIEPPPPPVTQELAESESNRRLEEAYPRALRDRLSIRGGPRKVAMEKFIADLNKAEDEVIAGNAPDWNDNRHWPKKQKNDRGVV